MSSVLPFSSLAGSPSRDLDMLDPFIQIDSNDYSAKASWHILQQLHPQMDMQSSVYPNLPALVVPLLSEARLSFVPGPGSCHARAPALWRVCAPGNWQHTLSLPGLGISRHGPAFTEAGPPEWGPSPQTPHPAKTPPPKPASAHSRCSSRSTLGLACRR